MSTENATNDRIQSLFERVIPFIIAIRAELPESRPDPDDNPENRPSPDESTREERIILINPLLDFISLFGGLQDKGGHPPASKSAVEALPRVEIKEGEEKRECVICLEELNVGSFVKEMPCHHGFHEECIEKWLGIHGNCPVCRYMLPVDQDDTKSEETESEEGDGDGGRRVNRAIWVSFSFGRRRSGDDEMVENVLDPMES